MITVRKNIFETNSSSTHCLVVTSKEDWAKFKNGEMLIDVYTGELTPITENMNVPKQLNNGKWEFNGKTYDELFDIDSSDYEWYDRSNMLYEAYCETGKDTCEKDLGDGRVAVAIYCYDD